MKIKVMKHGRLVLVVTALFLLLFAVNAQAVIDGITSTSPAPFFSLTAKPDYISTGEGNSVLIWGYANGTGTGRAQYPGPTLIVNEGALVTITLTNSLTVTAPDPVPNVSIVFPGQTGVSAVGGVTGLLTQEAAPGGTVTYTFTASHPGTYMYHSGTRPELQIEMGLVGAIIVRPTGFDEATNRVAYSHSDSAYNHEYLFMLSEMDSGTHEQVLLGMMGSIDNTAWWPVYWFINGRTGPDTLFPDNIPWLPTQPYGSLARMHPGEKVLLRVIGAGRELHPHHPHGNHVRIIAKDGRLLSSVPGTTGADLATTEFTIQSVPGETVDAIFTWTGKSLGWDMYGSIDTVSVCTDGNNDGFDDTVTTQLCHDATCTDGNGDGYDDATSEWCADHGKPFPVALPNKLDLTPGGFYSGSPFLGAMGPLPPGEGGFNPNAGFFYMWHSHTEKELVNFDIFPGGMLTMMVIEPPGTTIP